MITVFEEQGHQWSLVSLQAFAAVGQQPELKAKICANYANWLAENDRFVDAQKGKNAQLLRLGCLVFMHHSLERSSESSHSGT